MSFSKGEIISFDFEMPDGRGWLPHSGVILSCNDVYEHDKCYVCVMMSSNGERDKFSFVVDDNMVDKPNNRSDSQVRCHLITYVREKHIQHKNPFNKLKPQAFERLIAYINEAVFDV